MEEKKRGHHRSSTSVNMEIRWGEGEECRFHGWINVNGRCLPLHFRVQNEKKKKLEIFQVMLDALLNTSKGEFYRSIGSRKKKKIIFIFDGIKNEPTLFLILSATNFLIIILRIDIIHRVLIRKSTDFVKLFYNGRCACVSVRLEIYQRKFHQQLDDVRVPSSNWCETSRKLLLEQIL